MAARVSTAIPVAAPRRPPPLRARSLSRWLHANLFNNAHNTVLTLLCLTALVMAVPGIVRWAVLDAVWTSADGDECRKAFGACWAVVGEKYRLILFGTFPYEEHWRGWLVVVIIVALAIVSGFRRFWSWYLFLAWIAVTVVVFVLMLGGVFGAAKNRLWLDADVFLFPTRHQEGLPYALLEAMAAGCVPIITPVAAIPDVVQSESEGFLVSQGDVARYVTVVAQLDDDRKRLGQLAQCARRRIAEHYTLTRLAADFDRIYRGVLHEKPSTPQ